MKKNILIIIATCSLSIIYSSQIKSPISCLQENFPGLTLMSADNVTFMSSVCACLGQSRGFLYAFSCPGCPKWDNVINESSSRNLIGYCNKNSGGLGTNIYTPVETIEQIAKILNGSNKYKYDGTTAP